MPRGLESQKTSWRRIELKLQNLKRTKLQGVVGLRDGIEAQKLLGQKGQWFFYSRGLDRKTKMQTA